MERRLALVVASPWRAETGVELEGRSRRERERSAFTSEGAETVGETWRLAPLKTKATVNNSEGLPVGARLATAHHDHGGAKVGARGIAPTLEIRKRRERGSGSPRCRPHGDLQRHSGLV